MSAVVAVPFSFCANGIQKFVSSLWEMSRKAKAAKEAAEELGEDFIDLELGPDRPLENVQSQIDKYLEKGKGKAEDLISVVKEAEEAEKFSMMNPYGCVKRFNASNKLTNSLDGLSDFKEHGTLTAVNGIRGLILLNQKRHDEFSLRFSPGSCSTLFPVGMNLNVERLTKMLVESKVPWIHIAGMGGMGKSLLAWIVCDNPKVKEYFGRNILWVDCGHHGHEDPFQKLLGTQESLFLHLTGNAGPLIFPTLSRGNAVIQDLIVRKQQSSQAPYLLVLDNVQSRRVLEFFDFLGTSRISTTIVTSRQRDILEGHIDKKDQEVVRIGRLSEEEACELFCRHAFGKEGPPDEKKYYVKRFVSYSNGMPLMLKVLGGFMRTKTEPREWEKVLKQIKKKISTFEGSDQAYEILKISYDALNNKDRERFLFLASSRYSTRAEVYHCWRGLNLVSDIEEYEQACDKFVSAGLIEERREGYYYETPEMITELAYYIMRKDNLLDSLRMINFHSKEEEESFTYSSAAASIKISGRDMSLDYFSRFEKLQALRVKNVKNVFDCEAAHMPLSIKQLKYLDFELDIIDAASELQTLCNALQQLTQLEFLSLSRILPMKHDPFHNILKDMVLDVGFLKNMPHLMEFHLHFNADSSDIINSHYIQELRQLERLTFPFFQDWDCGHLKHLKEVTVHTGTGTEIHMTGPSRFLSTTSVSDSLVGLQLEGVMFSEVPRLNCPSMKYLHLEVIMERLPRDYLQSLPSLQDLALNGGGKLMELPSFANLPKLRSLDISGLALSRWRITADEQTSFENLSNLKVTDCKHLDDLSAAFDISPQELLRRCPIQQFPHCFAGCEEINIEDCKNLTHLPSPMERLRRVRLIGLDSLELLAVIESLPYLKKLELTRLTEFILCQDYRVDCKSLQYSWHGLETKHLDGTEFSSCFPNLELMVVKHCS